jgi:triosephosphate isomerase
VCCGETDAERDEGATEAKVEGQVRAALKGIAGDHELFAVT